ncbi:MAG: transposase [Opitutus sp.]|nr:transposase [Opitutus sp.]
MACKLRLEFPGAIYHVINRGNYRTWIFADTATRSVFESCLFEACERTAWLLHAYVVMSNHYHLAVETPAGNLVAGMQWLQSTFANRFNRCRREHGHVFQSRYKSLLVEEGDALGAVCDYIHLNPVRAGIVEPLNLLSYRHSSYWFLHQKKRPGFLCVGTALTAAGGLADSARGRAAYANYLTWQAAEGPAGKNEAYVSMSKGWAIGSAGFKASLVRDYELAPIVRAWELNGARKISAVRWQLALERALRRIGKSAADCRADRKSAPWKIAVADHLKQSTHASNRWLTEHLQMGAPVAVSQYVSAFRHHRSTDQSFIRQFTEKLKA